MLEKLAPVLGLRRPHPAAEKPSLVAFLDYAWMPYALGDALTWLEKAQVRAREADASAIDIVLLASPERPAPSWQTHLTAYNFVASLHGVMPAFFSSPIVRNVHVLEYRQTFYDMVSDLHEQGAATWPEIDALVEERVNFISHLSIVEHFRRWNSIPLLGPPRGYGAQAAAFIDAHCRDRFRVVVNVRQSHLTAARANPERDSRIEIWAEFIALAAKRYSDVIFIVVGQYSDVDRAFFRLPSVVIPRARGLGLGVELALLQGADLFMGTSSGFAQAAFFGHPSYVVTHVEPRAAPYCGVEIGARHHPFGRPDQLLTWTPETVEGLVEDFEMVLALKARRGERVPAVHLNAPGRA
jgi:hypothetical protein